MTSPETDLSAALRRTVYAICMVVGAAGICGRILSVDMVDLVQLEKSKGYQPGEVRLPFLSANDRSRWMTIRALVEYGTYQLDEIVTEQNWNSIDVVKHDGRGRAAPNVGEGHFYSSKPPLLSTLIAGEYWLIHRLTGYSLREHPFFIGRFMLITVNVPTILLMWLLLARHVERYGRTDFGRVFTVSSAVFGTMHTTFAVTLNNHLFAAVSAMLLCDAVVRIVAEGDVRPRRFFQAGVFAAFLVVNELPALSIAALAGAGLLWKFPRPTIAAFLPGAALVTAAAFGTNYAAHHTIIPAYAHRAEGNNWYVYQFERNGSIRQSYWSDPGNLSGIDRGEPSRAMYAFHVLIGHHGIFSLTPIWLLSVVGLWKLCRRTDDPLRAVAAGIAAASLVCLVFYLSRPQIDRNYGGMASGFRWVFWFAPLWLVGMLPAADACARRRSLRALCLALLAVSVVSVAYPTWNPWTLPWLMHWFDYMEWSPSPY